MIRESGLVVETLDRIRQGLPFALDGEHSGRSKSELREVASALGPTEAPGGDTGRSGDLAALADGEQLPAQHMSRRICRPLWPLSSAWRGGEARPTFSIEG